MQVALTDIIRRLKEGQFVNEEARKQAIVLRLLSELGWETYDPKSVSPEFSVVGSRVDYALRYPSEKPRVFIEVKQQATFESGEEQLLMGYAFKRGVPIAVLTDGQQWSFYLPSGEGFFQERRFCYFDMFQENGDEVERRLRRYLSFDAVKDGSFYKSAQADYDDAARHRAVKGAMPQAWTEMLQQADSRLALALVEKVDAATGFRPNEEEVEDFLKSQVSKEQRTTSKIPSTKKPQKGVGEVPKANTVSVEEISFAAVEAEVPNWFSINDEAKTESSKAIDVTVEGLKALAALIPDFYVVFEKEAIAFRAKGKSNGEKRRWIASKPEDLYQRQDPQLLKASRQLSENWWLGTNYSNSDKRNMLEVAKKIATRFDVKFEFDLE